MHEDDVLSDQWHQQGHQAGIPRQGQEGGIMLGDAHAVVGHSLVMVDPGGNNAGAASPCAVSGIPRRA